MADVDATDAPFSISVEGEDSGELMTGDFRAKYRLSLRDQLNRDKIRRELLGDLGGTPDDRALSIAIIVAELSVRLTKTPIWWKDKDGGLDLCDGNVLGAVYDKALEIERKKKEEQKKKAEEARGELRKVAEENKTPEP